MANMPDTGQRLLVADDGPKDGKQIARVLADLGYDVVGRARSGLEAMDAAEQHRPDLVLVNVQLPGAIDGLGIARAIDDIFGIPTMYLYGEDAGADPGGIPASAPYGLLRKPFGLRQLQAAVELALHRARQGAGPDRTPPDPRDEFLAVLDTSGTVKHVSRAVEAVLGVSPDHYVGRAYVDRTHPEDRSLVGRAVQTAFEDPDRVLRVASRFLTTAGGWRSLQVEGRVYGARAGGRTFGNGGPEPLWMVTRARDVAERPPEVRVDGGRAQPRRDVVRSAAGGFEATLAGEITNANAALTDLLGYGSPREICGRPLEELVAEAEMSDRIFDHAREGKELGSLEARLKTRRGEDVFVLLCTSVVGSAGEDDPRLVGTVMDITERKRQESLLERLAFEDPLTGLANRHALDEHASKYLALAERRDALVGLIFLDLVGFKQINDRFGHPAGDAVLVEMARRLQTGARESDVVGRVGGDEFVALLPDVEDQDAVVAVARRMKRALEDAPIELEDARTTIRAEAGISVYPEHGSTLDDLIRSADRAMYRAKRRDDDVDGGDVDGTAVVADTGDRPSSGRTRR